MYSIVLMAAMTATAEAPGFGTHYGDKFWINHCFWEDCWPARYGWTCGPGWGGIYPAPITACHGGWGGCGGCYGCGGGCWGGCGGHIDWFLTGHWHWEGCHGCGGCGGCYGYPYYHGYLGDGPGPYVGIGYQGGGAYGNFGMYGAFPVPQEPNFGVGEGIPYDARPVETRPEIKSLDVKPLEVKPIEVKPMDVKPMEKRLLFVPPAEPASIVVQVPAGAKVFIDKQLMKSTSTVRVFKSPPLEPGESYFYMVRVVVEKDGQEIEEVRKVSVRAGGKSLLAFDKLFDGNRSGGRTVVETKVKRPDE